MEPVTAAEAFTFERELIAEVEHLNGTDLHLFGVEITAVTLQGAFPNTTLIIEFIDRRSSTEVDRYPILGSKTRTAVPQARNLRRL